MFLLPFLKLDYLNYLSYEWSTDCLWLAQVGQSTVKSSFDMCLKFFFYIKIPACFTEFVIMEDKWILQLLIINYDGSATSCFA